MWTDIDVNEREREPRRSEGWTGNSFTDGQLDNRTERQIYIPFLCLFTLLSFLIVTLGPGAVAVSTSSYFVCSTQELNLAGGRCRIEELQLLCPSPDYLLSTGRQDGQVPFRRCVVGLQARTQKLKGTTGGTTREERGKRRRRRDIPKSLPMPTS